MEVAGIVIFILVIAGLYGLVTLYIEDRKSVV